MSCRRDRAQHCRQSRYFIPHLPPGSLACCGTGASASPKLWALSSHPSPAVPELGARAAPRAARCHQSPAGVTGCVLGVLLKGSGGFDGEMPLCGHGCTMQQHSENTAWLYGCLGMERAISKSQWAFQEGQFTPPCHTHENRQLGASAVFFLKISLPLL